MVVTDRFLRERAPLSSGFRSHLAGTEPARSQPAGTAFARLPAVREQSDSAGGPLEISPELVQPRQRVQAIDGSALPKVIDPAKIAPPADPSHAIDHRADIP